MGMRSFPRFRQTFRGGAALECRSESRDISRTVHPALHVEPKQSRTWPAFIGEVQEPRFSQIDTSSYAANIGIQADVIITDGAASQKSMYRQDRGVAQYIQKLWEYPSLCRVFCSFQLRDSQG